MNLLFIHQNFPGQFRHVAAALVETGQHQIVGVGDMANLKRRPPLHPKIQALPYSPHARRQDHTHHYLRGFENHVRRGQSVVRALEPLLKKGFRPDVLVAHPGWGEALFLRELLPQAKHVHHFEFFYRAHGADVGFDPDFPATVDDRFKVGIKNSTQLHALADCTHGISPTEWQRSRYPVEFQSKIQVLHEGIDTTRVKPDPLAELKVGNLTFRAGDEVLTYVARNLEPYRGFHVFMRALPAILERRPNAHVLIVGGDDVSYGRRPPEGSTYRELLLKEVGPGLPLERVHFLGKLPYADYLKVLQISRAHVYLTYPFVLSWSMLEAMAAGCLVIGSATPPVQEVIENGTNGLLVDFFDSKALIGNVCEALERHQSFDDLRATARNTIIERYDLNSLCLPGWIKAITTG